MAQPLYSAGVPGPAAAEVVVPIFHTPPGQYHYIMQLKTNTIKNQIKQHYLSLQKYGQNHIQYLVGR